MKINEGPYRRLELLDNFDPIKTNYRVAGFMDGIKGLAYGAALLSTIGIYFVDPIYAFGLTAYFAGKFIGWNANKIKKKAKRMEWAQQECYDNPEVHRNFMEALKKDDLERKL